MASPSGPTARWRSWSRPAVSDWWNLPILLEITLWALAAGHHGHRAAAHLDGAPAGAGGGPRGLSPGYGGAPAGRTIRGMAEIPSSLPQSSPETGTSRVKRGMAEMLKGGVIMDVVTPDQAKIAEDAGAVAVMALERVPADIRAQGGVSRMSDPDMIDGIIEAVSIPVMAKARIGHFAEAQVLQSLGVDYVDESEVLTPADYANHIDKWAFTVPFVCGATNLGEALRRITEGAAMIRSKGEAGTGDVSNAVTHMRTIRAEIRRLGVAVARRALRRREGAAGAVRPGRRGRRERQAARRTLHRRRHRHPRRRRDDDAARRRGSLRRAPASSSPATPPSAPRRSSRRPRSTTTRTSSRRSRAASARRWSASTSRTSRSRTGWPSAAGESRVWYRPFEPFVRNSRNCPFFWVIIASHRKLLRSTHQSRWGAAAGEAPHRDVWRFRGSPTSLGCRWLQSGSCCSVQLLPSGSAKVHEPAPGLVVDALRLDAAGGEVGERLVGRADDRLDRPEGPGLHLAEARGRRRSSRPSRAG